MPVALSSSIACTSARTTHCRFTGPVPSLISRKHSAPLSATRPVLTQPPTTMEAPMSDAPFSGHACTAETETRSYSLLYLFLMVPASAAAPSEAVCFACTAASTAASCALSSPRSMSARAAMMIAGKPNERRVRLRRARASRRMASGRGRSALEQARRRSITVLSSIHRFLHRNRKARPETEIENGAAVLAVLLVLAQPTRHVT